MGSSRCWVPHTPTQLQAVSGRASLCSLLVTAFDRSDIFNFLFYLVLISLSALLLDLFLIAYNLLLEQSSFSLTLLFQGT